MNFFAELKRRNVLRIGGCWLALSWLLAAMCALLFPALGLPLTALRWLIVALAAALLPLLLLAWSFTLTPQGFRRERRSAVREQHTAIIAKRLDQVTVVLVLAALSLTLIRQFIDSVGPEPASSTNATVAAPVTPAAPTAPTAAAVRQAGPIDPHSLAVLPFTNTSTSDADAYFGDGLAEELLNVLARIGGLKVTSRTSSFSFRNQSISAQAVGEQLGVAYLLEGSVRRNDGRIRITTQLIRTRDDQHVWSAAYDRELVDIFQLQEEIAQAIADALADTLGVRQVTVAPATTDMQAYDRYLRGRQLFAQRGANLPAARELLEQAVALDPEFADAWAALAGTWYVWTSYAAAPDGVDTRQRAEQAAARALAIDPAHPGALAVSARLAAEAGDRLRHAELIAAALAAEPNSANSWLWQGLGLFEVGHLEAAHASFVQAQRLDPLSGLQLGWLGITTALRGDVEAGRAMLEQAHALGWRGPASRALFLLANKGEPDSALQQAFLDWLGDDVSLPPAQRELARSWASALNDPTRQAAAQDSLLAAMAAEPDLEWATLLYLFGLNEAALQAAQRADRPHTQGLLLSLWYPQFRNFREHPAFMAFARSRGLFDYWRVNGPPDHCGLIENELAHLACTQ